MLLLSSGRSPLKILRVPFYQRNVFLVPWCFVFIIIVIMIVVSVFFFIIAAMPVEMEIPASSSRTSSSFAPRWWLCPRKPTPEKDSQPSRLVVSSPPSSPHRRSLRLSGSLLVVAVAAFCRLLSGSSSILGGSRTVFVLKGIPVLGIFGSKDCSVGRRVEAIHQPETTCFCR